MNLAEYENIETKLHLDDSVIYGVRWWDLVRYRTYLNSIGGALPVMALPASPIFILKRLMVSCWGLIFLPGNIDTLILSHPRKRKINERWVDIYTEYILNDLRTLGYKPLMVEKVSRFGDAKYQREVLLADLIYLISVILSRLMMLVPSPARYRAGRHLRQKLDRLKSFGVSISYRSTIKRMYQFRVEKFLFKRILKRTKATCAFIVVGSGNEAFLQACRESRVTTFELQHGSPARGKLNYDYSSGVKKTYVPDYFLSFGHYFVSKVNYAVPKESIVNIGFPYLSSQKDQFKGLDSPACEEKYVVISQPDIDLEVLPQIRSLVNQNFQAQIVVLKHPQYFGNACPLDELDEYANVSVVDSSYISIYEYFSTSTAVFGCYSTALLEATYFGAKVFIFKFDKQYLVEDELKKRIFMPIESFVAGETVEQDKKKVGSSNIFENYNVDKLRLIMKLVEQ